MNPSQLSSTYAIVAAYNEERQIASVLRGLREGGYQVVAVDDGSTDRTYEECLACDAHVLRHPLNLGQGAALQTGITYALRNGAKFLATFDADGQHRLEDLNAVLSPLYQGAVEVALGSRFALGGSAEDIPLLRVVMLKIATMLTRVSTGLALSDTHNGLRAFTRSAALKLRITQNRMAHASEILAQVAEHKLSYREVPVTILYSAYSLEKGQRLSNSFNILWESLTGILKR